MVFSGHTHLSFQSLDVNQYSVCKIFRTMLLYEHYLHAYINVILHEPVLGWGDSGFYMIFQEVMESNQCADCRFSFAYVYYFP